jgi:hypothetical protein
MPVFCAFSVLLLDRSRLPPRDHVDNSRRRNRYRLKRRSGLGGGRRSSLGSDFTHLMMVLQSLLLSTTDSFWGCFPFLCRCYLFSSTGLGPRNEPEVRLSQNVALMVDIFECSREIRK